ncbi:MAG: flippase-like domain-containing protein [Archaeoglobaceae archaeon]
MKVSIVLPAYNEAERIEEAVKRVEEAAKNLDYDYEIIIAEDGSKDGTDRIAAEIAKKNPKVKHLHSDERLGRGRALMRAFNAAEGEVVVYMDVDLATDLVHLKEIVNAVAVEGYDIATGSRLMRESYVERPFKRDIASKVYNLLVRFLLGSKLRDHQCGFKAFKKDSILKVGELVKDNHWFWDTEVLVIAQKKGMRVKEIPVRWKHGGATKVSFRRDVLYMFSQILRMWIKEKNRSILLFTTFLAILILFSLIYLSGVSNFAARLAEMDYIVVALALLFYSSSFLLRGLRFSYVMRKLGYNAGTIFSTAAVSISQTVNVITPIRVGDLARSYIFAKKGVKYEESLGGIAAERLFDITSIAIIAALSAAYLGISVGEIIYAVIFSVFLVVAILMFSRMENFFGRIFKNAKLLLKLKDSIVLLALSSMIWLFDIVTCSIILSNFGSNFVLASLAVAVGNIVKAIPITPGGVGTYEAAVAIFLSKNFDFSTSFAVAFVDHLVKNVATVLLGLISALALNVKIRDLK